jgi:pentapeptide MXKDX repeat protein
MSDLRALLLPPDFSRRLRRRLRSYLSMPQSRGTSQREPTRLNIDRRVCGKILYAGLVTFFRMGHPTRRPKYVLPNPYNKRRPIMKQMLCRMMILLCLSVAPLATFAQSSDNMKQDQSQDQMKQDQMKHDDMKKDEMKKDEMKKDEMKKDKKASKKKDKMKKDSMKKDDNMKHDDSMKQN